MLHRLTTVGLLLAIAAPVSADVIYESATLGEIDQGAGTSLLTTQFLGSRFTLDQETTITGIGGHLYMSSGDTLFGAIVALNGDFPTGSPFDPGEVLASTTFKAEFPSSDILAPLNITLPAGDYGLVFGSGLFGSISGNGAMPGNNFNTPAGEASYFAWFNETWYNGAGVDNVRFVVEGSAATSCTSDMDGDGEINAADLAILLGNWGPCACTSDINGDGEVNAADLAILLGNWGPC